MPANKLKRLLNRVADGATLSASEMEEALDLLMSGVATPVRHWIELIDEALS